MARKISLALYQLSINRKGKRDDRIVLSDFMNGFDIINELFNTLRYNSVNEDVAQNRDEEKFFRIMKRDGRDLLFTCG